ncbi:hypothetical protein HHK36_033167 [Tetracentron sinense]|uniref:Thionin-like protein 2 n=1 Tax=Tetracentron sinense TaxID=13715 RepID=A0A834Y7Y8_TETSI|nr:hypothetical protein HHK36_033167 [Tetracentron sinense]
MEGRSLRAIVLMVVVLGMLEGHCTSAFFFKCYGKCFSDCMRITHSPVCAVTCLKQCLTSSSTSNTNNFCKLGCALSSCSTISTAQYHRVEEVEDCVDNCSKTCTTAS